MSHKEWLSRMDSHCNHVQRHESATIWRADDIGDLELLHARYIRHAFARHTHEGATIGIIEDGAERFYYRGAMHTAVAGQIVTFDPEEPHSGEAADQYGWRFRLFYINPSLFHQLGGDPQKFAHRAPHFRQPIIDDPLFATALRQLHLQLESPGNKLERQSSFFDVMARFTERHARPTLTTQALKQNKEVVSRVRQYLDLNYNQNVTLESLASVANLSSYHLVRVFRATVGLPPHAYLGQIRINHAKRLLLLRQSVADVAFLTGFSDQSHLTKHFKKMTGVTPGKYQRDMAPKISSSFDKAATLRRYRRVTPE